VLDRQGEIVERTYFVQHYDGHIPRSRG